MTGTKIAATTVMTSRVWCAEAALQTVRDGPGPEETIARGNSGVKTAATAATMPSALRANATPGRPARTRIPDTVKASPQPAASTTGTVPPRAPGPWEPPADSHAAVPTTSAPASGESQAAPRAARAARGPAVLSERNAAPCAVNMTRLANPPTTATGASRPGRPPR